MSERSVVGLVYFAFVALAACETRRVLSGGDAGSPMGDRPQDTSPQDVSSGAACGDHFGHCNVVSGSGCTPGLPERGCYQGDDGLHDGTICAPPGAGTDGTPCNPRLGSSECQAGFNCMVEFGRCVRFCCDVSDCGGTLPGLTPTCFRATQLPTGVGVCLYACSVLDVGDSCPSHLTYCAMAPTQSGSAQICYPRRTSPPTPEGGTCTAPNDCANGFDCVLLSGTATCRQYCDPANLIAHPCPVNRTCRARPTPPLGLCIPNV